MIGFIITAVGIPIFGVAAIGATHSDGLQTLAEQGRQRATACSLRAILYLTIGPALRHPEMRDHVSFTTGVIPMLGGCDPASRIALLIFSCRFLRPRALLLAPTRQDHALDRTR